MPQRNARSRFSNAAALAALASLAVVAEGACKPVQNTETLVLNNAISFQGGGCGRNAEYFSLTWCAVPEVRLRTLVAPAGLAHLQPAIDFSAFADDNFQNIASTYGRGRVATTVENRGNAFYRVTDFHAPGLQALVGNEWTSAARLPGSYAGVWAALSATTQRLEFPKFSADVFKRYFTPGSTEARQVSFVKELVEAELRPVARPPVNVNLALLARSRDERALIQRRNELLLPGDVLLVMERSSVAKAPQAAGAQPQTGAVKALLAQDAAVSAVPTSASRGEDTGCIKNGRLVHAAILVERDIYFETVLNARGATFRLGFFDDVALNAEAASGKAIASLCFAFVRRDVVQGGEVPLPLASQLGSQSFLTGISLAPQDANVAARKWDDPLKGRIQALPNQGLVPFTLVP